MSKAIIPPGCWPRRMNAAMAAGYVGEVSAEAFRRRVGIDYPAPRVDQGRRQLWLIDDLDHAMGCTPMYGSFYSRSSAFENVDDEF